MGLGVSIVLVAAGAILAWAVNADVSGVDIHTIGWILLIVGIVGAVLSMIFWSSWAGPGYWSRPRAAAATSTRARRPTRATAFIPGAAERPLRASGGNFCVAAASAVDALQPGPRAQLLERLPCLRRAAGASPRPPAACAARSSRVTAT